MSGSVLQSFIPWILYFVLAGSQTVSGGIAALAGFVATLIFSFKYLRKKSILDVGTVFYFLFLSLIFLLPIKTWVYHYAFLLSNIFLATIMWVSVSIKQPFSSIYAKEKVDELTALTPTFQQINMAISSVWALALSFMAIDGFLQSINIIQSNMLSDIIIASLFVIAIHFTRWFPRWYPGYLFKKFSKQKEDISKNPFLQGNYAPVTEELFVSDLTVEGKLPKALDGIYMRNGANPAFDPISYTYPIDGDGMIHAVYIHQGKAEYRNRFVQTKGLIAEKRAGCALYGGIRKPIPTDPKLIGKDGDPGPIKDGAFIHIIRHAQHYLAMYESGPAYEITSQLQTIGEWCPNGASSPFPINAHTRLDPFTGELFAFTYDLKPPYLRYYVLDQQGNLTQNIPIEKSHSSMMHDCILTENYVVFFDCPAIFDFKAMATGGQLLSWKPELGTKIAVVKRKTNEVIWIETDPFFVFHFANGFEKNQTIIIDYVRHEKLSLGAEMSSHISPSLWRATIDLNSKTVKHTQHTDHVVEFPRINDALISKSNRYIYLPTTTSSDRQKNFNALMQYDLEKQSTFIHDFGKNIEIGEAIFIPNPATKQENDGYVGLFAYDKKENNSNFVLLNAQTITDEPVASIKLPQRVPHGLHGSWMPVELCIANNSSNPL